MQRVVAFTATGSGNILEYRYTSLPNLKGRVAVHAHWQAVTVPGGADWGDDEPESGRSRSQWRGRRQGVGRVKFRRRHWHSVRVTPRGIFMCPSWEGTSVRYTWPLADPNLNP